LGLADKLAKLGVRPGAHHQRRWDDGRTLLKTPLGDTVITAFGFPHYQSHRADVLSMLIDALPAEHGCYRVGGLCEHDRHGTGHRRAVSAQAAARVL
jgi:salicylate hydroxylase